MADLIGQRLGQYEITALLGEGGMATVYRARQLNIKRDVAVKIIESKLARNPEFVKRFEREAQTIAALSHPHILKLFDFGQQSELLYLVMELQRGGSLADLIRKGLLPLEHVSELLHQIASALDYAHEQGIIHRDLKPQNVLLDTKGNAILTDFGIAKVLNETTALTASGMSMGTPSYMSPEQWQGHALDARSDIYALGVMLFEMLSGRLPFSGDTPASIMYRHLMETPPAIRTLRLDLPGGIDAIIGKALAKDRNQRFASAGELAVAFNTAELDSAPPVKQVQEEATPTSPIPYTPDYSPPEMQATPSEDGASATEPEPPSFIPELQSTPPQGVKIPANPAPQHRESPPQASATVYRVPMTPRRESHARQFTRGRLAAMGIGGLLAMIVIVGAALGLILYAIVFSNTPSSTATDAAKSTGQTMVAQSDVPEVEIRSPADQSEVIMLNEALVYVRAVDRIGVTHIEMWVNNQVVDTSALPEASGAPTVDSILSWTPSTPGPNVIRVVAFRGSTRGNPKTITLIVRGSAAQVTNPAGSSVFLTASPTADPTCRIRVDVNSLNLRSGPGANYDVISSLSMGSTFPVAGSNYDRSWWQINVMGLTGWVNGSFTTQLGICSMALVVQAPPSPTPPLGTTAILLPPTFTPLPTLPPPTPSSTIPIVSLPTQTRIPRDPTNTLTPSITSTPRIRCVVIVKDSAVVRSRPNLNSTPISTAYQPQQMNVIDIQTTDGFTWYSVEYTVDKILVTGWVQATRVQELLGTGTCR